MEGFKQRLILFARESYNMGQTRFEDYCGLSHGTISSIKVKGPSADIIMKISSKCPELNLNWLFRGIGEMTIGETPAPAKENRFVMNDIHDNDNVILSYVQDVVKGAIKEAYKEIKNEYHL